ncbi:MAG: hypothetical protein HGA61_00195 [Candidatus Moranbacteria bacterium]|nr:hypothetical protein [Candidatus Moranbacteria bacterium]
MKPHKSDSPHTQKTGKFDKVEQVFKKVYNGFEGNYSSKILRVGLPATLGVALRAGGGRFWRLFV